MDLKASKETAKKTAFVAVGAPVVVARKLKDFGTKMVSDTQAKIDTYATEGEKVTKQIKDRHVVEEFEHRMNIDKVQDRVEQLRDQLENTLSNWRESFTPAAEETAKKTATAKPATEKAPASKATAKKAPAKKKTSKKAPASKATTKKAPAKKTTAKKAPAQAAAGK